MINAKTITDCLSAKFQTHEIKISGHVRSGYSVMITSDQFQDVPDYMRQAIVRDLLDATFHEDELVLINLVLTFTPQEFEAFIEKSMRLTAP